MMNANYLKVIISVLTATFLIVNCSFLQSSEVEMLGKKNVLFELANALNSEERKQGIQNRDKAFYVSENSGPLENAVLFGYIDVVKYLADDYTVIEKEGAKAIHVAASMGRVEIINLLLKKKVNVNSKAWNGTTPIFSAVEYGEIESICLLLKYGADVNYKIDLPFSLMTLSLLEKRYATAQLLINYGYMVTEKDKNFIASVINKLEESGRIKSDNTALIDKLSMIKMGVKTGTKPGSENNCF